jgi:hypothetical protein
MKKFILILLVLGLLLLITSEKNITWCKKVFGIEANHQDIEMKKYYQQLSEKYYGTMEYWKELSLVNNSLAYNESDLLIPSMASIQRLKLKRSVSLKNDFYVSKLDDSNNTM